MILTAHQAKEVGEALVDAAQRSKEEDNDHYVVHLTDQDKALCLPVDPAIDSYGYKIIAHVTKP